MITETLSESASSRGKRVHTEHLFKICEGSRPLALGSRHALSGVDCIEIGRSDESVLRRDGSTLVLGVADSAMSKRHAFLRREDLHWVLEDAGAKNGCVVRGLRLTRAVVGAGDLIELGRTVFCIGEACAVPVEQPLDLFLDGMAQPPGFWTLLPSLQERFEEAGRLAASQSSILILGDTGTGKELVAAAIHQLSARRGPLVAINCGAIPPALIASELFGARRGAFSGADQDRPGMVLRSSGGSLFLDEIGDLPLEAQAALLRTLENREVRALGDTVTHRVDLRAIAATHHDLLRARDEGRFRDDLLARLSGHTIRLPKLAERRVDVGSMIAVQLQAHGIGHGDLQIQPMAVRALCSYSWPHNVRELAKCIERALALGESEIALEHLPAELRGDSDQALPDLAPEERARRETIISLLEKHGGNISAVSREMGKVRPQVQRWLRRYGIDPSAYRH